MQFEDGDEEKIMSEINMTPLIDIMLVLLILFMVTSSMSLESGLDVELPQVKGQTGETEGSAVIISLSGGGELSVQGRKTTLVDLGRAIREALLAEKTGLVILEGDRQANLGNAVEIMDIAKAAGALKFAIAAESEN